MEETLETFRAGERYEVRFCRFCGGKGARAVPYRVPAARVCWACEGSGVELVRNADSEPDTLGWREFGTVHV